MKFLLFSIISLFTVAGVSAQVFTLNLEAPQYKKGVAYLTYYYGENMNLVDSAAFNQNGKVTFQHKDTLQPGVYSIVFPGKRLRYDLLIGSEQQLNVQVKDSTSPIASGNVTGSKENDLFMPYQKYVLKIGEQLEREKQAFAQSTTKNDSLAHQAKFRELNKEIQGYREQVIEDHPESMLAALFNVMKEPKIVHPLPKNHQDTLENYQYYKEHYWDGVTFTDNRIIRSPFFLPKLERYYRDIMDASPDSIIPEMDYMILLSRTNFEMYKYLINWFTDEYYNPKIMGQDKIFVHLFEKYHAQGISTWLSDSQHESISRRAYMVMSNLVGDPAGPLIMTDADGSVKSLYDIKSDFTLVSFWTPTCSHCKKEIPEMDSIYQSKWKKEGVKIYAVLTENEAKDKWQDFINEHHLKDWTNVYETEAQKKAIEDSGKPSYYQLYDVIQTPTLYLLDKDKKIIAKKLTLEQIDAIITAKLARN